MREKYIYQKLDYTLIKFGSSGKGLTDLSSPNDDNFITDITDQDADKIIKHVNKLMDTILRINEDYPDLIEEYI